jgi:NTE family protein
MILYCLNPAEEYNMGMDKNGTKKVGLALGGGYARGLAHIGVIELLEKEGIPIDLISGTSIGAVIGALYSHKLDISEIKTLAKKLDMAGVTALVDLTLPRSGIIGGKRITGLLHRLLGDITFEDLKLPFRCVATDITTGDEVVLQEGSVLEAVRASISIPVIFSVLKEQGRYLVDGGLVNPVPVNVARQMGADFVIAVDVTPDKIERANYLKENVENKPPNIFHVMVQSIYITTYLSARKVSEGADTIIHPHLAHIAPNEFYRAGEAILEGEMTAIDCLPEIKKKLAEAGIPLKPREHILEPKI